jgi:hypothetical protein
MSFDFHDDVIEAAIALLTALQPFRDRPYFGTDQRESSVEG